MGHCRRIQRPRPKCRIIKRHICASEGRCPGAKNRPIIELFGHPARPEPFFELVGRVLAKRLAAIRTPAILNQLVVTKLRIESQQPPWLDVQFEPQHATATTLPTKRSFL